MRAILRVAVCVLALLTTPIPRAPAATNESPADIWQRLTLVGNESFSAASIVEGLRKDCRTLMAVYRGAAGPQLMATLEQRVLAGYRSAGFPDASVKAAQDSASGRIQLQIHEGARYRKGDIRVTGLKTIAVDQVVEAFTEAYRPPEAVKPAFGSTADRRVTSWLDQKGNEVRVSPPLWKQGDWAAFDRSDTAKLSKQLEQALFDMGRVDAVFRLDVKPLPGKGVAELVIHIDDEGQPARVGEIWLTGNQRNSREAILDFLQVRPGITWTREEQTRVEHALWSCGRFTKHDVSYRHAKSVYERNLLIIDLAEYGKAPLLGAPLSREEKTLLKAGDWLHNFHSRGDDAVAVLHSASGLCTVIIVSPEHGTLITVGESVRPQDALLAATAMPGKLSLHLLQDQQKLAALVPMSQLQFSLTPHLQDGGQELFRNTFGVHIHGSFNREPCSHPLAFFFSIPPVTRIAKAHEDDALCHWDRDLLTVAQELNSEMKVKELRVDGRSGAIVEYRITWGSETSQWKEFRLRFRKGEFSRCHDVIAQRWASHPDQFDPDHPIGSSLAFLLRPNIIEPAKRQLEQALKDKPELERTRAMDVAGCVVTFLRCAGEQGALEPLEKHLRRAKPKDEFDIPFGQDDATRFVGFRALAVLTLPCMDPIVPAQSWPWTLWKTAAMAVAGDTSATRQGILTLLESQENGPLCYWLASVLAEKVSDDGCRLLADMGLQRLSLERLNTTAAYCSTIVWPAVELFAWPPLASAT